MSEHGYYRVNEDWLLPEVPPVEVPDWQNEWLFPGHLWGPSCPKKDYNWPSWKFGMRRRDMFTTLPRRFNLIAVPLLDMDVFGHDVMELSRVSNDKEELFRRMAERQDQRRKELYDIWYETWTQLMLHPELLQKTWEEKHQDMRRIYHFSSFDALARFFACHLPTEGSGMSSIPVPPETDQDPSSPASMATAYTHLSSDHDTIPQIRREPPPRDIFATVPPKPTPVRPTTPSASSRVETISPRSRTISRESRESGRIRYSEPLRRSNRLQQKQVVEEDPQPPPPDMGGDAASSGGKRKRGQANNHIQAAATVGEPNAKRRKDTGTTGGKRKRGQEEDHNPTTMAQEESSAKRRRGQEEGHDLRARPTRRGGRLGARERRKDTGTSSGKGKKGQEEGHNLTNGTQGESSIKRKRNDIDTRSPPPVTIPRSKRKRESDEADNQGPQISQKQEGSGAKRRKSGEDTIPLQDIASPPGPPGLQTTRGASTASRAARAGRGQGKGRARARATS
ncbi:hypothetical protein VM1G_02557 [Cytospora mali]|uniref:Uncharacterized protein n=1 Tax=Cytospora mali TaxID=578113 RepID=A0A194VQ58_CYTMA|nr:hypothetical protein VM1G_02557 [Valsa mali]